MPGKKMLTRRLSLTAPLFCALLVTCGLVARAVELESIPDRGFQRAGSYALTDIETINTTNGNLMLSIPLATLPAGRGGNPGFTLRLLYNSKIWDSFTDIAPDPLDPRRDVEVHWLTDSEEGGWRYNLARYNPVVDNRNNHYENPCPPTQACGIYIWKLRLSYPDGSLREFRPVGYNDYFGDGYYSVRPGGNLTYFSTDGSYARLEYRGSESEWTLYFPDGTRIVNTAGGWQRTYDRNDNYTEIQFVSNYNGTGRPASLVVDQMGRSIAVQSNGNNEELIHSTGPNGTQVTTVVRWGATYVSKTYNARTHFTYNVTWEDYGIRGVKEIILPSQAGGDLRYTFGYNAHSTQGTGVPSHGWGELSSVTLPSGARATYQYDRDGENGGGGGIGALVNYEYVQKNHPTRKDLNYTLEYDGGAAAAPTETWLYSTGTTGSTVTAPDGGVTQEYFGNTDNPGITSGLVFKSVRPDGSVVERIWLQNRPGIESIPSNVSVNSYIKTEFTSVPDAAGNLVKTAVKDYNYDKDGNLLRVAEYDWVSYGSIPRDSYGKPTGVPWGAQPTRETVNTYHVNTPDASVTWNGYGAYHWRGSPRLLHSIKSSETGPGGGARQARTEFFYDDATTRGNLTLRTSWDSARGPLSNPLHAGNSVSSAFQYDAYGNLTLSTDPRGTQKHLTYGNVGGFTNLYPTEIRSAYSTPVQVTTVNEYDFHTGLTTRTLDADNNVATSTAYDAFGRPTLVRVAEGRPEESRTSTTYSDVARRVIVRSDLNTAGDGKLVTAHHFDQRGRVRLTRRLEDAAAESAEDEATGLKAQTRYMVSGGFTYTLVSQPYRGGNSAATRGWARTKRDRVGRVVETHTFQGGAMPGPWGGNASSTGAVTTAFDAEFTTVTDQAGKVRRTAADALGQLARVDEPDAAGNLGPTYAPVQPTSYAYNALGNLTNVYQGTQTRSFQFSSLSRLLSVTSPESGTTSYTYDAGGNMLTRADARGVVITYGYDALGRTRTTDYSDTPVAPDIERFYDGAVNGRGRFWYDYAGGNYSAGSEVEHRAVDAYDPLGRPKIERRVFKTGGVWGANFVVQRSYDLAGNVRTQTYPSGRTVEYGYDAAGRLNDFRGNLGDGTQRVYSTGYLYDEQNRVLQERYGTATPVYNKRFYNSSGQPSEIRVSTYSLTTPGQETNWNRGALINHFSNQSWAGSGSDNNGNLRKQDVYIPSDDAISGYSLTTFFYEYDSLNRLDVVREVRNGQNSWVQDFDYDRWGNRTINAANTWGGVPEPQFTVDPATNRLGVPGGYGGSMQYDAAGNLTYDTHTGGGTRTYDAEGRMTSAQFVSGQLQTATYRYDADGLRTRRRVGVSEVWQVHGVEGEMLAEYAPGAQPSSPQKEYGYRAGELLITASPSGGGGGGNLAQGKPATQSTDGWGGVPSRAVDGNTDGNWNAGSVTHTLGGYQDWWQVDLGSVQSVGAVRLWNRTDCCGDRLSNFYVLISDAPFNSTDLSATLAQPGVSGYHTPGQVGTMAEVAVNRTARYLRVQLAGTNYLSLAEVQVLAGGASGLRGEYFNSLDFTNPALTRTDATVNFDWGGGSPAAGVTVDNFTTRWTGTVTPVYSQTYTFYTVTDDGVRLWVNGQLVIDKWIDQAPTEWSGQITLQANTPYQIRLEFYERGGGAMARLYWSSASQPKEIVPSSRLTAPSGAGVNWLVTDQLGTPRMILDQTGSLAAVRRRDYLPFGEEMFAGLGGRTTQQGYLGGGGLRQGFTGKERDDETSLDYFGARYYSPAQGRFISADEPLVGVHAKDPQTWNAYAYTSNNPLNRVDLDGQRWAMQERNGMIYYQWFDHLKKGEDGLTDYDRAIAQGGGWSPVDFDETQAYIYQPGSAGKDYQLNPDGTHNWVTPIEDNSNAAMAGAVVATRAAPGPSKGIVYAILAFFGLVTAEQTNLLNNLPQPPALDPNIYNQSKHNKEVIDGLVGTAVEHIEKIRNNPTSRDVPHWKGEIKAALDRAKNIAERLKGKTKEATKEKIREIEQQVDDN